MVLPKAIILNLILALVLCARPAVAASPWPPEASTLLNKNTACFLKSGDAALKVRKKVAPKRFTFKSYLASKIKSLNSKYAKLSRQSRKERSAARKKELKREMKALLKTMEALDSCSQMLGVRLGCEVAVAPLPELALVSGGERSVVLSVNSSCSGSFSVELLQEPVQGTVSLSGTTITYALPPGASTGREQTQVRVCFRNASDLIEGCSAPTALSLNSCALSVGTPPQAVVENRTTEFALGASTSCSAGVQYEITGQPQNGSVSVDAQGIASYRVGYVTGNDTFRYRVCDVSGAGCSDEATVQVMVNAGDSFSGDENSLLPYRQHISQSEREYLVRKLANNRFDLISGDGAALPLSNLIEQRFLANDVFAPDLQATLEQVRERNLLYGRPISSEEFIPDWQLDFPDGDPALWKSILPESLDLGTAEGLRYGMDRWLMTTHRGWHSGNHRYHWGWDYSIAYYLTRARYLSPLHTRLLNFWMAHFGTSTQILNGFQENLVGYYVKILEREAAGNFRTMMLGDPAVVDSNGCLADLSQDWAPNHGSILCDAVSNMWLSNHLNSGENQNFARELMELYLTSPTDEFTGMRNYSEPQDIIGATRFVSGIRVQPTGLHDWLFAAKFVSGQHSSEPSSMFGELAVMDSNLPLVEASMEPGQFVRHVLDHHPGVSRFIAGKLFASFVYPDPSDALVAELGQKLRDLDYDLGEFLKVILNSEAMFSPRAAGRNCVSSPLEVYSRIFNAVGLPLLPYRNADVAQNFYVVRVGWDLQNAGEVPLAYPSVFSYDYCGRDPGKNGSTAWLESYLLVFRVTGIVNFLNHHQYEFGTAGDLFDVVSRIRQNPLYADGSPESILAFFEHAFGLNLNQAERAILMEYLTHRKSGGDAPTPIAWNPDDALMMREKIAGLMTILSAFNQSATH